MQDTNGITGIEVDEHVQSWSLAISCKYFMDVNLESVPDIERRLTRVLTEQKLDRYGSRLCNDTAEECPI